MLYIMQTNGSNINHLVALSVYIPKGKQVPVHQEVVEVACNKFEVNK